MSRHVHAELILLAQNELPTGERARVEAHLRVCAACRAEADELEELTGALRTLPAALRRWPSRNAVSTWSAVWARVAGVTGRPARRAPPASIYVSAAMLLLACVTALPATSAAQRQAVVTADTAHSPAAAQSTAIYRMASLPGAELAVPAAPVGTSRLATSAGSQSMRPIPVETPEPGPRG